MTDTIYPVSEQAKKHTHLNKVQYLEMYQQSVAFPDSFWAEQAKVLDWYKFPKKLKYIIQ
ncbi:acetate--CoA ligase [Paraglaciecola psychrophila 170]|uniref:Acetate--CoA ligase n=1 Tax=Paraglaciecola psychrophila 170 TaxID=1129794 RepID=M4RTI9_9ALTE|nr:acetate--CoA ligase [Paraglaciecola psychrophila 170]